MAEVPELEIISSSNLTSFLDISSEVPPEIQSRIKELIKCHKDAFGFDDWLGNPPVEVWIDTVPGAHPISLPMYEASSQKRGVIDAQIDKWLEQEVIEPSKSPWAVLVIIVYCDCKPQFCVDHQKLNSVAIPDEFPIPWQMEILQALLGAQVLSTLDALAGFNQLSIASEDQEKTGFRSHRGLHQFKRLPFGLCNGPSVFQRVMQGILAPFLWIFSLVYINNIVVYSKSYDEHLAHLDQVLQAVKEAQITLSPQKCHFTYTSILLLWQKVSHLRLSTHAKKVRAITELVAPSNVHTLQSFLGMVVYFSHYIPGYASIASPLFGLLKKKARWSWGRDHETAFHTIQNALASAPILGHPMQGQPFWVYSDASDVALGACLQQVQPIHLGDMKGTKIYDFALEAHCKGASVPRIAKLASTCTLDVPPPGEWALPLEDTLLQVHQFIVYWSRTLKSAERNYSATKWEALGVKEALVKFQPFIEGEKNIVIIEHTTLVWARTYENTNRRLAAWGTVFGAFPGLDIVHRAGKVHSNIDLLSRLLRILLHQSPAIDETQPISDVILEQPIKAWETVIKEPALKATFLVTTWEEMLEASPEDPSAWVVTRKQVRKPGLKKGDVEKEEQAEQKGGQKEEGEVGHRRSENRRSARDKTENKPGQLVVSIAR